MSSNTDSIFKRYYSNEPFVDRFISQPQKAIDVIIPLIHSNELWEANLRSIYREVPVNRLLIGDGGCIDDTIEIAKKFPRVVVFDHRQYKSLGYSERFMIGAVETEWFLHTHSDVFLPDGWFDTMIKYQDQYDFYGCLEQGTIMVEVERPFGGRPWVGAQMVRKKAVEDKVSKIDDDFVYRQNDFVYRRMIQEGGFKEGFVRDTFHYHQTMHRPSAWFRKVTAVDLKVEMTPKEELRDLTTSLKGCIKYLLPSEPGALAMAQAALLRLLEMNELNWNDFQRWVKEVNPVWLPYVSRRWVLKKQLKAFLRTFFLAVLK